MKPDITKRLYAANNELLAFGKDFSEVLLDAAGEIERLRTALTELRNRIKAHPAYANLTESEEIACGGDTAELSYLARVADAVLGHND